MRKIAILILVAILLTGCNEKSNNKNETVNSNSTKSTELQANTEIKTIDTQPEEKNTEPTKVSVDVYPNESKMSKDIDSIGGNVITFNETQSYTLTTSTVTIDKASKNEKNLTVYCTAKQESKEFTAANKYLLTYNFYEIGGWILDDCTLQEINMTPIAICPEVLATQTLHEFFGFTHSDYIKSEKVNDAEYIIYYKGYIEYAYADRIFDCMVRCCYDDAWGWACYPDYEDCYYDFTKMYYCWYIEDTTYGNKENSGRKCLVNVKQVDWKNGTVTFNIEMQKGGLYIEPTDFVGYISYTSQHEVKNYDRPYYYVEIALPEEIVGPYSNPMCIYFDENYGVKEVRYDCDSMMIIGKY